MSGQLFAGPENRYGFLGGSDTTTDSLICAANGTMYQAKAKTNAPFQIDEPTALQILRVGAASARK
jgi:hypothetical protein